MKGAFKILAVLVIVAAVVISAFVIVEENNRFKTTDYSNNDNWMYAQTDGDEEVDLFYIYPTVVMTSDRDDGFANITPEMKASAHDAFDITGSAFSSYTNVFAPYYRQYSMEKEMQFADYYDFYNTIPNSVAYKDLEAALDYYFEHFNNGRPFIFAGHSQGSACILVLLEKYMAAHPIEYTRMVAAYAIGFGVPQDYLDRNTHIRFAQSEDDLGVLISWNTEGPANAGGYKTNNLLGNNPVLINPLSWSRETAKVSKENNPGSLVETDTGYTIVAGLHDAQINATRGSLTCTTCTDYTIFEGFGDVSLHSHDYDLYYKSIQDNGKERAEAYLATTDYSNTANWMYKQTDGDEEVDLFYIYPTVATVSDRSDGCANISDEMKKSAKNAYKENGYAFEGYTNVYAPYYRQIALDTMLKLGNYDDTCDFVETSTAVRDIYASLDYYFANYNNGRPFILAGHSQGSAMILAVLENYMAAHPNEYSRMVAAYAVGFGVTQDYLDRNPHIHFAQKSNDTGVLISWNTEGIPADGVYKDSLLIGKNTRVINPISWSCSTEYVDKSNNKGELKVLDEEKYIITTVPGVNDAQINAVRGSLICTTNTNFIPAAVFGDVSLHGEDYVLYFKDIQVNGQDRIAAYLAK